MTTLERNIKKNAKKAKAWTKSDSGKAEIKQALQEAREFTKQFNIARQIDPKSLHDPVTL